MEIELVKTCESCPEQYDAYFGGREVAYLRLRWGCFEVFYNFAQYKEGKTELIYSHDFTMNEEGFDVGYKGQFDDEAERNYYLKKAKKAILERLRKETV